MDKLRLKPGRLVILEGPDGVGKSTQINLVKRSFSSETLFAHQPSSSEILGRTVYELTRADGPLPPLARQFLHLASHSELFGNQILPALKEGGAFLDRCWWSTIAYGYFGTALQGIIPYADFEQLVQLPALGKSPDLLFLMLTQRTTDAVPQSVVDAYLFLAERFADYTVLVPDGNQTDSNEFILSCLFDRDLVQRP